MDRRDGGDEAAKMADDQSPEQLSESEHRALACVLDEIIPPSGDGRLPGAGQLGLARHVSDAVGRTPESRAVVVLGLAALDARARARGGESFAALPAGPRREVMNEVAAEDVGFVFTVLFHAYIGYYQHREVLRGLGREPRPPHPLGYTMAPDDLTLLDDVRRRPRLYREV